MPELTCPSCLAPREHVSFDAPCPSCGSQLGEVPCVACGYELSGLRDVKQCPECGCDALASVRARSLSTSDPVWVRRLARAALIASVWPSLVGVLGVFLVLVASSGGNGVHPVVFAFFSFGGMAAFFAAQLVASISLSSRPSDEPREVRHRPLLGRYRAIGMTQGVLGLLGAGALAVATLLPRGTMQNAGLQHDVQAVFYVVCLACAALLLLVMPAHFVLAMLSLERLLTLSADGKKGIHVRWLIAVVLASWVAAVVGARFGVPTWALVLLAMGWHSATWGTAYQRFSRDATRASVYALAVLVNRKD
jgi:hypothetical protein